MLFIIHYGYIYVVMYTDVYVYICVAGVVGVVAKPMVGVLDAASNTLQGIGNTAGFLLDEVVENERQRPQRYIDPVTKHLTIYDLKAAKKQARERRVAGKKMKLI